MNKQTKSHMVDIACVASVPFFLAAQLKSQLVYLAKAGMRVLVLTAPGPELEQFPWSESLMHEPVDIRRRPAPWRDLRALFRLIQIFQNKRPIIVHSTTPKAGLLTAVAAWLVRIPIRLHTFTGQQWVTIYNLHS